MSDVWIDVMQPGMDALSGGVAQPWATSTDVINRPIVYIKHKMCRYTCIKSFVPVLSTNLILLYMYALRLVCHEKSQLEP